MPHADKRAAPNRWTEHLVDMGCQMLALALTQPLRNMGVGRSNSQPVPWPTSKGENPDLPILGRSGHWQTCHTQAELPVVEWTGDHRG